MDIESIARIIDPEAFGLPDNAEPNSLSDRDIARDRAKIIYREIERLRTALAKYGIHTDDCDLPETHGEKPCNCGWSALICEISNEQLTP